VALLLFCSPDHPGVPARPAGPDTLATRRAGVFRFYGTNERLERVRYIVDWADRTGDTSSELRTGDTVEFSHAWSDTGPFAVRCRAQDEALRLSDWSEPDTVYIVNRAPLTPSGVSGARTVRPNEDSTFAAATTDPEQDLITYVFDWGDGTSTTAPGYASGDSVRMLHAWADTGLFAVRVKARDQYAHESDWSPSHEVTVEP